MCGWLRVAARQSWLRPGSTPCAAATTSYRSRSTPRAGPRDFSSKPSRATPRVRVALASKGRAPATPWARDRVDGPALRIRPVLVRRLINSPLRLLVTCLVIGVAFSCLASPEPCMAVISPAGVLYGPTNDIVDVDGVAMAPDGSGGALYRRNVDGVVHLFAIPFANGHWGTPAEVDGEDLYGASQPAIAAAEGGRLLVVWVQPRNVSSNGVKLYELM